MTVERARDEALRLVGLADEAGVPLRILGGTAIELLVPAWPGRGERPGRDIDVATTSASRRRVTDLLEREGYVADRRYNAAAGHKQLYFVDQTRSRPLDVLIDRLEMCHVVDLRSSLAAAGPTVLPADLLLSKLQVVKLTRKDIVDALALLSWLPVVDRGEGIDATTVITYVSRDWGWWRTATNSLEALVRFRDQESEIAELVFTDPPPFEPGGQAKRLLALIEASPKSVSWRARARIGERMRWYEEPEEETH